MRKIALICCLAFLTMSLGQRSFAQESTPAPEPTKASQAPAHFYHLDFVVQELGADGKPANSRSYSATVSTDPRDHGTSIRTGSKLPIATGSSSSSNGKELFDTQWQYVDVGVNIDVHSAREVGRQLSLELIADVSSMAAGVSFDSNRQGDRRVYIRLARQQREYADRGDGHGTAISSGTFLGPEHLATEHHGAAMSRDILVAQVMNSLRFTALSFVAIECPLRAELRSN
jgi:hypothetical protein